MSGYFNVGGHQYFFNRWPVSDDRSLKAWNAADELLLNSISEEGELASVSIYHDRFGFLSKLVHAQRTYSYVIQHSQKAAISYYIHDMAHVTIHPLMDEHTFPAVHHTLIKIPKSLDLFEWYLSHAHASSTFDSVCFAGFLTRHFSPEYLVIARRYFEHVIQSRAVKKSRVIKMWGKKELPVFSSLTELSYQNHVLQQYTGVFSADHVDYATQFLLERLFLSNQDRTILDLGCGNGVIGYVIKNQHPECTVHLMDDSLLAIASAKLNLRGGKVYFHEQYELDSFLDGQFDLIVTNPPFHFEYEVDMGISLRLFREARRILSKSGRLLIVANRHLNYLPHLLKDYPRVDIVAENKKYIIYEATT